MEFKAKRKVNVEFENWFFRKVTCDGRMEEEEKLRRRMEFRSCSCEDVRVRIRLQILDASLANKSCISLSENNYPFLNVPKN